MLEIDGFTITPLPGLAVECKVCKSTYIVYSSKAEQEVTEWAVTHMREEHSQLR